MTPSVHSLNALIQQTWTSEIDLEISHSAVVRNRKHTLIRNRQGISIALSEFWIRALQCITEEDSSIHNADTSE